MTETDLGLDYATTWDHVKFLIYRFATAISVAVVVLATAFVADHYGIPLPLLRVP